MFSVGLRNAPAAVKPTPHPARAELLDPFFLTPVSPAVNDQMV